MVAELSDNEKIQLAREVAADKYLYSRSLRDVFVEGWDAAMDHLRQREQESQS